MQIKTNNKFLGHHDTLIRDTRPSARIWNKLTDLYWTLTLNELTISGRKHILGADSEKSDIEYIATFKVEGSRIRGIITPKITGHYQTHLTKWCWFELKPKLKGEEKAIT